jgi:uncharacterized protein (UPF0548 family)
MLFFRRPERGSINSFISGQATEDFSYTAVGATRSELPSGFVVDHNRIELGRGKEAFDAARRALAEWRMFDLGWVEVFPSDAPLVTGSNVAVLARVFGVWFLNGCRIVYTVDDDGPVRRFGFGYGTLPDHTESGEERFTIEWRRREDSVWYDVLAFSRPNQFLAKLGYPVARVLQKRFAIDSMQAMLRHTRSSPAEK